MHPSLKRVQVQIKFFQAIELGLPNAIAINKNTGCKQLHPDFYSGTWTYMLGLWHLLAPDAIKPRLNDKGDGVSELSKAPVK